MIANVAKRVTHLGSHRLPDFAQSIFHLLIRFENVIGDMGRQDFRSEASVFSYGQMHYLLLETTQK